MTLQQREQGRGDTRQQRSSAWPLPTGAGHKACPASPWKRFIAMTTRPTILNLPWVLNTGWASTAAASSSAAVLAFLLGLSSCWAAGRFLDMSLSTSTMLLAAKAGVRRNKRGALIDLMALSSGSGSVLLAKRLWKSELNCLSFGQQLPFFCEHSHSSPLFHSFKPSNLQQTLTLCLCTSCALLWFCPTCSPPLTLR